MKPLAAVALCLLASLSAPAAPPRKGAEAPKKAGAPAPASQGLDAARLAALKARGIGPAVMGGRVADIALDPTDELTFYVGLATGGIFKTSNGGITFSPVFEHEPVASIGALAVAPSNPKIVWAGTGESTDRNSAGWGDGVYRSTNGGESWANVGLKTSHAIARIAVHPKDPATAWVAVVGDLWQTGGERGLFKTTDAGKTWKAVLQAPAPDTGSVGCGDLALDPMNPDVLYAALYARRRTPWSFMAGPAASGGKDVGGVFKSTDGGATWKKLTKGLPGSTGRIGLDLCRKDPRVVYALIQSDEGGQSSLREGRSKRGGVFRSEDGGESWTRMSPLNPRPFYFSQVRVDPDDDKRIYVLGMALHVSEDGGATFREDRFEKVHPDNHALVVAGPVRRPTPAPPKEAAVTAGEKPAVEATAAPAAAVTLAAKPEATPKAPISLRLILGTDGGVYQSYDAGRTWDHLNQIPAGEFYRVTLDSSSPYRIAGGLQDNLNWVGPSRTYTKDGIQNSDWVNLGGGDGFYCVFDPDDPDTLFAESQQGEVHRINLKNGEMKRLRPEPGEGQRPFRFHWCAPLLGSRHEKGTMYLAGNRVFRLTKRGDEWEAISPDLSRRDPEKILATRSGAENYGVVYALAESPVQKGLLWAGTDDGKLWKTVDGGGTWVDLSANVPVPAQGEWVECVEASPHDPKVAYLAVSAYRSGNLAPLLYRTADGGTTWQSIAANLPADGPVRVVREDPGRAGLLYAGTEHGLFVSLEGGAGWTKLGGLPTVAVDDVVVHPRERDLVIATHGRSLYVLDDVSPLYELTPEAMSKDAFLFAPRPAFGRHPLPGGEAWGGKRAFRGKNPPDGALLTFWLKDAVPEGVKISVTNAAGQPVADLKVAGLPGMNRTSWDLMRTKDLVLPYGGDLKDRFVPSGDYTVTLTAGKTKVTKKLAVRIAEGVETR